MPLTDLAIRSAKPRAKPYKLGDALGLFLLVQPSGSKLWRLKYRFDGKEKKLAFGTYPEVSLGDARNRRAEARDLLGDTFANAIEAGDPVPFGFGLAVAIAVLEAAGCCERDAYDRSSRLGGADFWSLADEADEGDGVLHDFDLSQLFFRPRDHPFD